ncbi:MULTISPECIES: MaoC family dehydratase [unclassified Hoeflea]|jgi:acyl dehydratase|uniref:MaoC family dehydratase n=1 Tax=unclassified Hoeflea TaxID=2614931 RepID=UPI002AFE39C2|nr:MaoC family dehydratase [Hoeflea sp.]
MSIETDYELGVRRDLGSHVFTAEAIINFARQFDPQRFHVDPEAAKDTVFGGLCASGWHTSATWMKLNIRSIKNDVAKAQSEGRTPPEFGPSPGVRNIRWFKPVFAGDEIRYSRINRGARPLNSRPGWSVLETSAEAHDKAGNIVMSFDSAVLIKLPEAGD